MNSTFPRDGLRLRARRLLGRLAAVIVVGSLGLGMPPAASAADGDAEAPTDPGVELFLSTDADARIAPKSPLLGTVTIENGTKTDLSAGTVSVEINTTPLADGAALDAWLDKGTAGGSFRSLATETTPVVGDDADETVDVMVPAADLGTLRAGVYPLQARLSGASTQGEDGEAVPWNLTATTVVVVAEPGDARTAVIVPVTATPENGSLLTAEELTELTSADGDLTRLFEAVSDTSAILAVDPSIPAAIRMLGASAPAGAVQWLDDLESLPNDTFPLQFADADLTVQAQAGRTQQLGEPDLTPLLDPAQFPADPDEAEPTGEPSPSPTSAATPAAPQLPDNSELTALRGAQAGMVWPRAGVSEDDLAAFGDYLGDDVTTIVPSDSVQNGAAVHSAVGARDLLVTDSPTSTRLSAAVQQADPAAARSARAGAAGHLFFAQRRSPLTAIALDRSESRSPEALRDALLTFASPGMTLDALRAGAPASATLADAERGDRVAELNGMIASEERLTAFAGILDEPAVLLAPNRIRMLRAIGAGLTDEQFSARVAEHSERVTDTLSAVSVQKPKPVQLFTSAAPLPVWVRNDLPWPVTVNLFSSPSDNRLDIQPVTEVKALASETKRVDVPIEARVASGQVDVRFRLESPTGVPIGQPEVADVTLRADWEGIGLGILAGVIGLLLIVGVVRMVRRRRADDGAHPDAGDEASPQG